MSKPVALPGSIKSLVILSRLLLTFPGGDAATPAAGLNSEIAGISGRNSTT